MHTLRRQSRLLVAGDSAGPCITDLTGKCLLFHTLTRTGGSAGAIVQLRDPAGPARFTPSVRHALGCDATGRQVQNPRRAL